VVDQRHLLRHPDRMMQRHLRHCEADPDPPGAGCEGSGEADRVDVCAIAVEMMLGEPDHVEAELVAEASLGDALVNDRMIEVGIRRLREKEATELQTASSVIKGVGQRQGFFSQSAFSMLFCSSTYFR